MANENLLNAKDRNLNDILKSSNIYVVPSYQRDYSWNNDQWHDLWNDIENMMDQKNYHYMGAIVLQNMKNNIYNIIDGQQRLATLSILILSVINELKELINNGIDAVKNAERVEILMRQYIGEKDATSLTYSSKIVLNENNKLFYNDILLRFKEPAKLSKLIPGDHLLWNSYMYFKKEVHEKFNNKKGEDLADFLNNIIGDKLMFIRITVDDDISAYTIFETLNSRGVELAPTDLLKNYLFSIVAKSSSDLDVVTGKWNQLIKIISLKEFPVFLRYFILATRKEITKQYLFKEIKSFIRSKNDVFTLLDKLNKYAYYYNALDDDNDDLWSLNKECKHYIRVLKLFRVTQWKPLAMIAVERYSKDLTTVRKLLQMLVAISYRYNVIAKKQTNSMESVYSKAAIHFFQDTNSNIYTIKNEIKSLFIDDKQFKRSFEEKQFDTSNSSEKKVLRYTLYQIEKQYSGKNLDFESDSGTIEHILPESYPDTWKNKFERNEFNENVYRLGNLTILEQNINKISSNKIFLEKIKLYKDSKYDLNKRIISSYSDWTATNINKRQTDLSKMACSIWKINI